MRISTIFLSIIVLLIISCGDDTPLCTNEDKFLTVDLNSSIIPDRVQYDAGEVYYYKIAFETNYLPEDSMSIRAFFTLDNDTVGLDLYDDGVSYGLYRCDLVASNNVWSGGINSDDFFGEGEWILNIESYLGGSLIMEYEYDRTVYVRKNTPPAIEQITGISENDSLRSGFSTFQMSVAIEDPDNGSVYNDNQNLKLEIEGRPDYKFYEFVRDDPLSDMVIDIDSTFSSGLSTGRYSLEFTATDLYGASDSLMIDNVFLENLSPSIYDLSYPDTVFVPRDSTLFVEFAITVRANDPQGHLEHQDVDSVKITTVSTRQMRDDGKDLDILENDGIYTQAYTIGSSFFDGDQAEQPFTVRIRDKAGNTGNILTGKFIFVKYNNKIQDKNHREYNDESIYPDPFDIE